MGSVFPNRPTEPQQLLAVKPRAYHRNREFPVSSVVIVFTLPLLNLFRHETGPQLCQ